MTFGPLARRPGCEGLAGFCRGVITANVRYHTRGQERAILVYHMPR